METDLNAEKIYRQLSDLARENICQDALRVFAEIDSTQTYLINIAASEPRMVVAESQNAGKGRLERSWHSASGSNIMFSSSWCYKHVPEQLPALSLALIVVVAEYMKDNYDLPITIKWPNDLLLGGKKLAGLLLNVVTGQQCKVVAGLGLNVKQALTGEEIDQPWTDLYQQGIDNVDRNAMIAELVSRWVQVFVDYPKLGFAGFQERWNRLAHFQGELVHVQKQGANGANKFTGMMQGVDAQGLLVLTDQDQQIRISDSSYSLRSAIK